MAMVLDENVLKPSPFGRGNSDLWQLQYDVEDERFLRIFDDIAVLIRQSESACAEAAKQNNPDLEAFVADSESDYLEELIGASFIILQTKIRRVTSSALALHKAMLNEHCITISKLSSPDLIRSLCEIQAASFIQLVWDVGNYYKHHDEWSDEVWRTPRPTKTKDPLKQSRQTRRSVERLGIVFASTGNMRTAYKFFGINPYSQCKQLAVCSATIRMTSQRQSG